MACQLWEPQPPNSVSLGVLLSKMVTLQVLPSPAPTALFPGSKEQGYVRVLCKFKVPYKYELLLFPAGVVWDCFNEGIIHD